MVILSRIFHGKPHADAPQARVARFPFVAHQGEPEAARPADCRTIDYGTGYYNDVATESGIGCADLSLAREGGGKGCRQVQKGDGVSVLGTTRDRAFVKVTYFARWNTLWVPANILTLRPR